MTTALPYAALGTGHPLSPAPRLTAQGILLLILVSGPSVLAATLDAGQDFAHLTWPLAEPRTAQRRPRQPSSRRCGSYRC